MVNLISKLFKFTVHIKKISCLEEKLTFQNFSSLQFIFKKLVDSLNISIFQNFSSLQFILIFITNNRRKQKFQNFSSLQFIYQNLSFTSP